MARLLVLVSYRIFPAQMGGQKGIARFYEYLRQHHTLFMVVSTDNPTVETGYSVKRVLYPHAKMVCNLFKLPELRKLVIENRLDGIIAEHSYTGWVAWLLQKITGKPFLLHSHNLEASRFRQMNKPGWQLYRFYEKWIHRKAIFSFFKTGEERTWALAHFHLDPEKTFVVPYGVENEHQIVNARQELKERYGVKSTNLFYFNGTLDYVPNVEAVKTLLSVIDPLLQQSGLDYQILISGKNLSKTLQEEISRTKNILYLGFVEDVNQLYQASTLFLNPVVNDSGIKTKVVEAIANHCTVISTLSGATGIPLSVCSGKLKTAEDHNWPGYVDLMVKTIDEPGRQTPPEFFAYFSWANIAQKTAAKIDHLFSYA